MGEPTTKTTSANSVILLILPILSIHVKFLKTVEAMSDHGRAITNRNAP